MSDKGLFASICSFFGGLFSSDPASNNDGLTGVERYIRNQAAASSTGVDSYIQSQASATLTGVEQYIQNQANATQLTGVERYIRNQG